MAGESPDRSKQRESSAETTPASGGAVPEARDPRLPVARGSVDTATKVLSVRDRETGGEDPDSADDAADTPDGAEARADDARADTDAGAGADAKGDARLRAAVAAWVRSGDSKPAADSAGIDTAGTDTADSSAPSGVSDSEGAAKSEGAADVTDTTDGTDDPEGSGPAGTRTGSASEVRDPEPADAVQNGSADGEGRDDRPKADAGPEGATADAEGASGTPTGDDASEAPEDAPGASDAPGAVDGADAPDAKADVESAVESGTGAAPETATEPEAEALSPTAAEPDKAETAEKTRTAEKPEGSGAPEKPAASDAAAERGDSGVPEASEATEASDEPGDDGESGDDDAPKAGPGAKPVDQPTTTLKVPPTGPRVDQPTTMLKLGGGAKAKDAKGAPAEGEAERTSRFVALKPLDEPPARGAGPAGAAERTSQVPHLGPERTTQQPLPPKPPLDLLAELTNTPPPPETPVRTAIRRVKIWTPLVLLLAIVFAVVQTLRPLPTPSLALTAKDTYSFDGDKLSLPWPDEGQGWMDVEGIGTMDHFGKQTPVAIGSVAKTMTAYIVLKDHPLKSGEEGPKIEVDATAEKEGGYDKDNESTLNTVKKGDFLTEKQALSAIMIPSANNIARLLARWDAGSEAAFVEKMNDTAKELGMTGTTYTDPSGLKETTVSTAEDQVKLGNAVVRIPALVDITSAASWKDPSGLNHNNYNQLPYTMGAIGIKTGTTTKAGGNLLFAARKKVGGETVTVVGAILGQHKPSILDTVNAVSKTALTAARSALTSAKILKKGDVVGYVDDRLGGHTPVVVTQDVTAVGWAGSTVRLSFSSDDLPHTAKAGTKVGTLTVGDGAGGAVEVPVALQADLAEPGFGAKLTRIT